MKTAITANKKSTNKVNSSIHFYFIVNNRPNVRHKKTPEQANAGRLQTVCVSLTFAYLMNGFFKWFLGC